MEAAAEVHSYSYLMSADMVHCSAVATMDIRSHFPAVSRVKLDTSGCWTFEQTLLSTVGRL